MGHVGNIRKPQGFCFERSFLGKRSQDAPSIDCWTAGVTESLMENKQPLYMISLRLLKFMGMSQERNFPLLVTRVGLETSFGHSCKTPLE